MTYQGKFTEEQSRLIKKIISHLIAKTFQVPNHGMIVEHKGRPGNYYFVLPTVFQPNEGSVPLLDNYKINKKDTVIDFGTGSGVIALDSIKKGASIVYGIDINERALDSANINKIIRKYDGTVCFTNRIPASLELATQKADVLTANLPFTDEPAKNEADRIAYDPGLKTYYQLFTPNVIGWLKKEGRVYIAQANFGAVDRVLDIAKENGFSHKLIGQKDAWPGTGAVFYAFELRRKQW